MWVLKDTKVACASKILKKTNDRRVLECSKILILITQGIHILGLYHNNHSWPCTSNFFQNHKLEVILMQIGVIKLNALEFLSKTEHLKPISSYIIL